MDVFPIVYHPNSVLRERAKEITVFDDRLKDIARKMLNTMYEFRGVGLAANQVGILERIFVTDCSDERNDPRVFINLEIINQEGSVTGEEGCLSIPSVRGTVKRAKTVHCAYYDLDGNQKTIDAEGLLAVCIQHELDHLNGVLFFDHLSVLKRMVLLEKYQKYMKQSKSM